jgi:hypothetical protein
MNAPKLHPNFYHSGTIFIVPMRKWLGVPRHWGLATNNMGPDGIRTIIANAPDTKGPAEVSWSKFTDGWEYESAIYPGELSPQQVLHNAMLHWHIPYNLTEWNCEQFAKACHGLPPRSRQVEIVTAGLIAGGLIYAAATKLSRH